MSFDYSFKKAPTPLIPFPYKIATFKDRCLRERSSARPKGRRAGGWENVL